MSTQSLIDPIVTLNQAQQQLDALCAMLADNGNAADEKKASVHCASLTTLLRQLQSKAFTQWSQDQENAIAIISQMNQRLQSHIDAINQSLDQAQNIVKALAIADQIVAKARSIFIG